MKIIEYIKFRMFGLDSSLGFTFDYEPDVVSVDKVTVPAGYDSTDRILEAAKDTVAEGMNKNFVEIVDPARSEKSLIRKESIMN